MQKLLLILLTFRRDKAANVAMITALCGLPLFGMTGLAIDYALAMSNKARLDSAADAAVVAAITKTKSAINGGSTSSVGIALGQAQGVAAFKANAGSLSFAMVPNPTVTINQSGQVLTAQVTYAATSQNQFGKMFNVTNTSIGGKSSSSSILIPYYQFIFVVDVSGSMAVGGTAADISGLTNDPNIGCAFACHDPNHYNGTDYRVVAKADGWTLKIDYVNQAVQTFISQLQTQSASMPGVYSVGIYTFGTSFTKMLAPTTSLTTAKTTAATIDVEPILSKAYNWGNTYTTSALQSTITNLTNVGDGSSASSQKTFVIFLTDGIEDVVGTMESGWNEYGWWGRSTDVTYSNQCTLIKNTGATIISILAPYPVINNSEYTTLIAPWAGASTPNMTSTMQGCASSPTGFYQANDGPGITAAAQSALSGILQGMTRLTQ